MRRELSTEPGGLPSSARWLGFAGLIPQILIAAILIASPARFGPAAGGVALAYSGTILSFIGGAWWGLASRSQAHVHWVVWIAAVTPSLFAFAAIGGWAIGLPLKPSLFVTGAALIGTLGVDYRLAASGTSPPGWLSLRAALSIGLGSFTILIAMLS